MRDKRLFNLISVNKYLILLVFTLIFEGLFAQQMSVKSFKRAINDLEATLKGSEVFDQNGDRCALIKIKTTEQGFSFENGVLGIQKVRYEVGEVWVYVPQRTRFLIIINKTLNDRTRYNFNIPIEKGATYHMELVTGRVRTYIENEITTQYVVFNVNPKDALVELNGEQLVVENGSAQKLVQFGKYKYRVECPMYHPYAGQIEVNDAENQQILNIYLKPAFGWINFVDTLENKGAIVYVDGMNLGPLPIRSGELKSGNHKVKIVQNMYKPLEATVEVKDGEVTRFAPVLTPNFTVTTLKVGSDAEIWINGEFKAKNSWTGRLAAGVYRIECKKKSHRTTSTSKTIVRKSYNDTITLDAPIPIYGNLDISSSPIGAEIKIDGKPMGKTPYLLGKILIGEHEVELTKDNYSAYRKKITIEENKTTKLNAELSNICNFTITTNTAGASVYINDLYQGLTPYTGELPADIYKLVLKKDGYDTYITQLDLDGTISNFDYDLRSNQSNVTFNSNRYTGYISIDGIPEEYVIFPINRVLKHGKHVIKARYGRYDYKDEIFVTPHTSSINLQMKYNYVTKNQSYIYANLKAMNLLGYEAGLGFYANNWNFDLSYQAPISSTEIFWYKNGEYTDYYGQDYESSKYSVYNVTLKVGYGIKAGKRCRFTPAVGLGFNKPKEESLQYLSSSYMMNASGGLKFTIAIAKHCELLINPEYCTHLFATDGYKAVSEVSDYFTKWQNGFNLNCGLTIFF